MDSPETPAGDEFARIKDFLLFAKSNGMAIMELTSGSVHISIGDMGLPRSEPTSRALVSAEDQEKGWRQYAGPAFDAIIAAGGNPISGDVPDM